MTSNPAAPAVLFLVSDTGGGHRRAAEAIIAALADRHPGALLPVVVDPLAGPGANAPLRWLAALYGPVIRRAPWLWGAAYYLSNSGPAMWLLGRTVFAPAGRVVTAAVAATGPAVIVSCHPLTGRAAARAARPVPAVAGIPVITVVTDLAEAHVAWFRPAGGEVVVPTAAVQARSAAAGVPAASCTVAGLPVDTSPVQAAGPDRSALRRALGLDESRFIVLLMGGGEGCGGLARRAAAIVGRDRGVQVVVICGRNTGLQRKLAGRGALAGGRLAVLGFTADVTSWLSCADLLISKAGPGIIAEAACAGLPMLLTSHLPGQERGNAALVEQAGAGRRVRGVRRMVRELGRLQADPAALAAMRAGSRALARPGAAAEIAGLVAAAADRLPRQSTRGQSLPGRMPAGTRVSQ